MFLNAFLSHKHAFIFPKIGKILDQCTAHEFFSWLIFFKCAVLFCIKMLFLRKSVKFATNCLKYKFIPWLISFKCAIFFICINSLLFLRQSAKFATNFRKVNYSRELFRVPLYTDCSIDLREKFQVLSLHDAYFRYQM